MDINLKSTASSPADLRITDMKIVQIHQRGGPRFNSVLRIDTNQGLYGYGEVRDGASPVYALMLKRVILGENPCNI
ncbi:MAG: mandelate racemase/muconate lactonizing enzyme family protein, partial [Christensenellaceae bacterium]|nr:mandelate racemase/muconate lactonizing enzyme family protein [Christensenellaceae bacterium]